MLEFMNVKNFKTLLNASFPLRALNLFSGLNGMGKSSLIQSLLLLRQSYERNTLLDKGLLLNGDYVAIGSGQDALSSYSEQEEIILTLKWQELAAAICFEFDYQAEARLLPLRKMDADVELSNLSLFNAHFQYLHAERLGPKDHYPLSDFHVRDLNSLGQHGEYTVHFIAVNGAKDLKIPALQHPQAVVKTLLANLNAWMSAITPGLRITATVQPQFNSATLSYAFIQRNDITAPFKPQNVGFGLSYVLPVVTAILGSTPGDLLIIENPESHLHPAGQSLMGRLCAIAANHGVQLLIESHSDHFLNGIRVAVKQEILPTDAVKIFFLQRDQDQTASEIIYPNIDAEGRLDCWPKGFFDEWDRQLDELL